MVSENAKQATIIGAGIIGLCSALYLQRQGFIVTIIDRAGSGEGASYGNSGVLAIDSVVPLATPSVLAKLPRMLLEPSAPITVRWSYLPRLAPWLLRFLLASRPARVAAIADALHEIASRAICAYEPLLEMAGAQGLVRREGWLRLYETDKAFAGARPGLRIRERLGIAMQTLTPAEIRRMEPALAPVYRHGVFFPDDAWVTNPLRLSQALAAAFERQGGFIERATVLRIETDRGGPRRIVTRDGGYDIAAAALLVIAAGAFSKPFARQVGAAAPLDTERGYHVMFPAPGINLRTAIVHGEGLFAIMPMEHGVRFAGTVEFGGLDAPPNKARTDALSAHARRMFPDLNESGAATWMGFRPSMPDSLPVIGRSPRFPNVLLAFGHGHLGLTLGAITGKMVAAMASGQALDFDTSPYGVERFERLM